MNWIEWPEEPGFYWFFGYTSYKLQKRWGDEPELLPVKAHFGGDKKIMVHRWAEFLFQGNVHGKFLRMDEPALPELVRELL